MNQKVLAVFFALVAGAPIDAKEMEMLETITTIGTRTERALSELDASVTVKTADQLEGELARSLEDLVRFEPGVSTGGTGSRFGLDGISIRGIGGNRVLTTLDGIRLPEEFSFGPFLSSRRDFVDIDSLQRADIARGPISPLYGSDALGGVVAFVSKQPLDYLQPGRRGYLGVKTGYSSEDKGTVAALTLAGGSEQLSAIFLYTRRDAEETENKGKLGGTGATRELPDPQSAASDSLTARVVFRPNEVSKVSAAASYYGNQTDTQVLSDYGSVVFGTLLNSRDAQDERKRSSISLAYQYDGQTRVSDQLDSKIYYQTSDSHQLTMDNRLTLGETPVPQLRTRLSDFEQEIWGFQVNLVKQLTLGAVDHSLSYGLDYYETDNRSQRDGGTVNAITGAPIFEFSPFPTRDFPITSVDQAALYFQDEILFADGQLRVTPGIRYDRFSADTLADEVYLHGNPGSPIPEDYDDSEITAKLGVLYEFVDGKSIYARYSEGFRAPPYDDVNVGFTNVAGGYKTISNPELDSETSKGYELGVRFESPMGYLTMSAFINRYENFIESQSTAPAFLGTGGIDLSDGLFTFQSINLDSVEIKGVEASGALDIGVLNPRLDGLKLKAAMAYADGEEQVSGEPINSVEPMSAVFGLSYLHAAERWGGNLYLTLVAGKDVDDINSTDPRIEVGGYGLVDLMGHYKITDRLRVDAGVFNLTDKSYIRWADTAAIGGDAVGRFTQPGLNTRVTLRYEL